jgi:cysteine desulfurase
MGLPRELALGAIRFSLGRGSTQADIDRAVEVVPTVVAKVRKLAGVLGRAEGRYGGEATAPSPSSGQAVPPYRRTAEGNR